MSYGKYVKILLLVILTFVLFSSCNKNNTTYDNTVISAGYNDDESLLSINTDYGKLAFPAEWKDNLNISVIDNDVYTLCFYYGDIKAFELTFNGEYGSVLGTLKTENNNVVIRTVFEESETTEILNMQEDVNVILEYLEKNKNFSSGVIVADESIELFDISTDYVNLQYPKKWENRIVYKVNGDSVVFKYKNVKLFDVYFNSDDGVLLGYLNNTKISILSYEIDEDDFSGSQSDYETSLAMMEDSNVIFENLQKNKNFSLA